jgi:hypothetical protein
MANLYNGHVFPPPALTLDFTAQDFRGFGVAGRNFEDLISFSRAGATAWTRRADGKFYSAPENAPRWGEWAWNSTTSLLEPAGLLIEGSRQNLLTYSHNINNAAWVKTAAGGATFTAMTAIFNGKTPYKFTNDNAGDRSITQAFGTLGSAALCGFALMENVDAVSTTMSIADNSASNVALYTLTWADGSVAAGTQTSGTSQAAGSIALGTGPNGGALKLFWITGIPSNSGNGGTLRLRPTGSTTNALSVIVHNLQLEVGSFPSSPILTDAASVTRAADVATVATAGWFADGQPGSLMTEFVLPVVSNAVNQRLLSIDDGTANNRIFLTRTTGGVFDSFVVSGGSTQANIGAGSLASGTHKTALAWATNDIAMYRSGAQSGTDSSATLPSGITSVRVGTAYDASSPIFGYIRSLRYWPRRLSNTTLQAITA